MRLTGLVRLTRPRQWVKNLLVAAVPLAAGRLHESDVLVSTLLASVVFVGLSACVYVINDVADRHGDRRHPDKSRRPVASGEVSVKSAVGLACGLFALATVTAVLLVPGLVPVAAAYVALQAGYQLGLKRIVLVDIAVVAAGFVLRATAGGSASDLPVSSWFMTVTASAALFVVALKRYSEVVHLGTAGETRSVLTKYSESHLRTVWTTALTASIVFYALWATELSAGSSLALMTTVPFSLAMIRYSSFAQSNDAQAPEQIVLADPLLLTLGLVWLTLFVARTVVG